MKGLSEATNSFWNFYDASFCDIEEIYEAGVGEELMKSVNVLLCGSSHNVTRESEMVKATTCSEQIVRTPLSAWLAR